MFFIPNDISIKKILNIIFVISSLTVVSSTNNKSTDILPIILARRILFTDVFLFSNFFVPYKRRKSKIKFNTKNNSRYIFIVISPVLYYK